MNEQNKEPEVVLASNNGIISIALQVYAEFVEKQGGCKRVFDRATELSAIFMNKDSSEKYDFGVEL
jgi:hypothetical protein